MRRITPLLGAACALLAASATTAQARPAPRAAVAHAAHLPQGTHVGAPIAADREIDFSIGLRSRDALGLRALSTAVSDPSSPEFGHFLTTRQFAARFGATGAQLRALRAELRSQGLRITRTDRNDLTVSVAGPAARVQAALSTRLAEVRLPDGRRGVANTTIATLPASVASSVQSIEGLDPAAEPTSTLPAPARGASSAPRPAAHARPHVATGGPQPCAAATAATAPFTSSIKGYRGFGYTADLIATYYGFSTLYGQGNFGQGQSIALPEGEIVQPGDIAAYGACYGVTPNVAYKNVGTPGSPGVDGEAALDIEQIMGLAPQAHIDVYQYDGGGALSFATVAEAISDNKDKVISISYGACESVYGRSELSHQGTIFQEAAVQGQSVVASSGDTGSEGCYSPAKPDATTVQPQNFASQPTVLSVGGTSLFAGGAGAAEAPYNGANQGLEGVWNLGSYQSASGAIAYAGTGGGRSTAWKMPDYQSKAAAGLGVVNGASSGQPCGASSGYCREVPDVSADGDQLTGYAVYANDGTGSAWALEGGTSASTPLWAALLALTNDNPACRGTTIGEPNPYVYAAAGSNYAAYFRDTALGNPASGLTTNDATGQGGGLFPVTAGYDLTTGLGSPIAGALAPALCSLRAPVYTVSIPSPGTRKAFLGKRFTLKLKATDQGGLPLTVSAKGLPAGLTFNAKTRTISGTPRRLGTSKVRVSAVDHATNTGTRTFSIKVVKSVLTKPTISGVSLTGVVAGRSALAFTAAQRGSQGSKVRSVTIHTPKGFAIGRGNGGIHFRFPHHKVTNRHRKHHPTRFTTKRAGGKLTIRFHDTITKVTITVGRGTLSASDGVARVARTHQKVGVGIDVTDVQGMTGRHTFRVGLR